MPVFLIVEAEGLNPRPRKYSKIFYKLSSPEGERKSFPMV